MSYDLAVQLMQQMLWSAVLIAGPLLGVTLVTGLLISILQVATQLQEMTLSYVPKLIAAGLTMAFLGGWMLHELTGFSENMVGLIAQLGR